MYGSETFQNNAQNINNGYQYQAGFSRIAIVDNEAIFIDDEIYASGPIAGIGIANGVYYQLQLSNIERSISHRWRVRVFLLVANLVCLSIQ